MPLARGKKASDFFNVAFCFFKFDFISLPRFLNSLSCHLSHTHYCLCLCTHKPTSHCTSIHHAVSPLVLLSRVTLNSHHLFYLLLISHSMSPRLFALQEEGCTLRKSSSNFSISFLCFLLRNSAVLVWTVSYIIYLVKKSILIVSYLHLLFDLCGSKYSFVFVFPNRESIN